MPYQTGTYDVSQLLAIQNATVGEVGVEAVAEALRADLAAFNRVVQTELVGDIAAFTTDRMRAGGASTTGVMLEVDEYGDAPTHVETPTQNLGLPYRLFQHNIGWTERWMRKRTPADLQRANIGAQVAYLRTLMREIKRALMYSANYTFVDKLNDRLSIPVKRLANADGFPIPAGPFGDAFTAATHQHYTAEASLTAAGLVASRDTVIEHGVTGPVVIAISPSDATTVSALTGFVAAQYPAVLVASTTAQTVQRLEPALLNNRYIGQFGAAEVWTKPWAQASYAITYDAGAADAQKPVAIRQDDDPAFQGLYIAAQNSQHPLTAEFMQAEYGAGVVNRVKAAVHYFAGGSYTDPTLT